MIPADPDAVILHLPEELVVVDPSTCHGFRYSVTLRPVLHAALLDLTRPLNFSPLLLIVMWEAILTVLVAPAVVRPDARASAEAEAAIAATMRVLLRISSPFC